MWPKFDRTWPRIWMEHGHEYERNVATNMNETWPRIQRNVTRNVATNMTKWFIGHVVMWPGNSVTLWAMYRSRWTWPKTWPANISRGDETWPEVCDERDQNCDSFFLLATFDFFHFFHIFSCFSADTSRRRGSQKCALLKSRYHSRITFLSTFFKTEIAKKGLWKHA